MSLWSLFRFSLNLFSPNISAGFEDSLFNALHWLITLIEKEKTSVGNGAAFAAVITAILVTLKRLIAYLMNL